jgi:hypothetical protein
VGKRVDLSFYLGEWYGQLDTWAAKQHHIIGLPK